MQRDSDTTLATGDRLLDIVIVSVTGAREHLVRCLPSLRRYPLERGEAAIHLVDNASTDGTPELVSERFPEVKLTALEWNAGFSRANNLVLAQSSAPYVLLLNPDTEAVEPFLDALVELMESRPE
ncbi:MAG: glycosyltransferase, partial [Solirubrobacterales bacterium]